MKSYLKIVLFLALIPALALSVSVANIYRMNQDLRSALAANAPDIPRDKLAQITIQKFISKIDVEASLKRDVYFLDAMKVLSLAVLAFSAAFLVLVFAFGRASVGSRDLLLALFRPSYYITSLALALITVIDGALLVGAIYYGETLLINRIHVQLIAFIAIGAILGCGAVIRAIFLTLKRDVIEVEGDLLASESPVAKLIAETAASLGASGVDNIVVGDALTFYATETPVSVGGAALKGKTIFLSRTLCEYLSSAELKAIVAHELSHFIGLDTRYGQKFSPIYNGLVSSIQGLARNANGAMSFALFPTQIMFNYLLDSFATAEKKHSRERETVADGNAARVVDGKAFAAALVKVVALGKAWEEAYAEAQEADDENYEPWGSTLAVFSAADKHWDADFYGELLERELFHPYDSHPTLRDRLASIGVTLDEVIPAITFEPAEPASSLLK